MNQPLKISLNSQNFFKFKDLTVKISELPPFFDGNAEVHFNFNDLYMVISGKATVVVGEKFIGGEEIEAGEIRNCIIETPVEYNLKSGDIFFIPAGFAHKLKIDADKFVQYVIKIPHEEGI
jgi:mannose-6-phosphate isomerase-like protein (cupin superfamily)